METGSQRTKTDRIEKKVLLHAPHHRVWRAITDSKEFGSWFGLEVRRPFSAGAKVAAKITPTKVDREVAKQQRKYEGLPVDMTIDRIEPERLFSFRWHPGPAEGNTDFSDEPTTLVSFELEDAEGGVMLTLSESGFERIPADRRAEAIASNEEGWTHQMKLIEKYLAKE